MDGTAPLSIRFCDIIFDLNLTQLINQPTHITGNILDLILTSSPDSIFNLHIHYDLPLPIPSDHYIITFDIAASSVPVKTKGQIHLLKVTMRVFATLWVMWTSHFVFKLRTLRTLDLSGPLWITLSRMPSKNLFPLLLATSYNQQPTWLNSDI